MPLFCYLELPCDASVNSAGVDVDDHVDWDADGNGWGLIWESQEPELFLRHSLAALLPMQPLC